MLLRARQVISSKYGPTTITVGVVLKGRAKAYFHLLQEQQEEIEEEVHLNDYQNITEARDRIGHFITSVYNQKRPHSALGYLTPMEFQRQTLS